MNTVSTVTATLQRTFGSGRIAVRRAGDGRTRLADLRQEGALRLRLPRVAEHAAPEAVLINTAGGVTGGDCFDLAIELAPGSELWVTSQACEKVYRSVGGDAVQTVSLRVGANAGAVWLPQPAILFEGSAYRRELNVEIEPGARLFALEASVLGRAAMGERVTRCRLAERWRIRRQNRLLWASEFALDDSRALNSSAAMDGARAFATFVVAGHDAELALPRLRQLVGGWHGRAGVSAPGEVLVGMLLAPDADALMNDLRRLVEGFFARPMPRVWTC